MGLPQVKSPGHNRPLQQTIGTIALCLKYGGGGRSQGFPKYWPLDSWGDRDIFLIHQSYFVPGPKERGFPIASNREAKSKMSRCSLLSNRF
jgi:hypothetical protein